MFKNHKIVNKDKTENNTSFEVKDLYWKGFKEGKKQALEEVEKIIDEFPFGDYNRFELGVEMIRKELKQKLEKMK